MRFTNEHAAGRAEAPARRVRAATAAVLALAAITACATAAQEPGESARSEDGPVRPVGVELEMTERTDLEAVFERAGVSGGFVLYDVIGGAMTAVDLARVEEQRVPASTFKLPHTLIALQTGAVEDEHEVLPYGGEPQRVREWEQDMSLSEALPASNVPVYQEAARRVGHERMGTWVDRLDYGNRRIGEADGLDRFWLDGPLAISPREQTEFLAELARQELPVDTGHQALVRELARQEAGADHELFGKTGWSDSTDPGTGWWVGWVERGEDLYAFALVLDVETADEAGLRVPLGQELLAELDVIPAEDAD